MHASFFFSTFARNYQERMKKRLKSILVFILLLLPLATMAVFLFKTLDAKDGLTSSQINCILKDSKGYVWFGTPAGLYRYDGYVFKNFQTDSQDGSSLPDSYIQNIQESLDGNLWIKTSTGYCIYHPQTESFERDMKFAFGKMGISAIPSIIYIDRYKNFWGVIPSKGIFCYNMQQQTLHEFPYGSDIHSIPSGDICSISECRDGVLIVYENGMIACCDVMHHNTHTLWITSEIANQGLRHTNTLKAFTDQKENIWLYGQGTLFMYNKKANVWNTSIGNELGLTSVGSDNAVNGMAGDRQGNVWIGTERAGLVQMNVNTHEMQSVQPRSINNQWINETVRIQSVYIDNTDLLWIGTEKSGVAFCGKNIYRFASDLNGDVTAITEDANGKVWYGTSDHGVIGYDGTIASLKVSSLATTDDGSLWIGSRKNGLTRVKNGQVTIYSTARDSVRTILDDHINALCKDKVGNLWIATNGGLQVFNPKMNTFASYTKENGKLVTNNITSLFFNRGKGNNLLVGTSEGLIIVDLSTSEITHLTGNSTKLKPFSNNYVTQVFQDTRGLIWVGTREGLNILDMDNDNLHYLTEKQGLCNNNICGITEDNNHNMWVTTSNGVCRVVVQRNHETYNFGLYNYNTSDGLQSNEFNPGAICVKKDGTVIFGGLFGVNWPHTSKEKNIESLPRVMLTQLFIGEEEVLIGHEYDGNVLLSQSLNETSKIMLNYGQNTFSIMFAAGNYNQSERLQFMYWMEGYDDDWKNGDALKHGVTFNDLPPGSYTLHVKAISAEGAVSDQERKLDIEVSMPWYLSWWMLTVYAIIIIVAVYIWRYGKKQYNDMWLKKKAVVSELKRQREEIKLASDELRQPMARMTSIIGNLSEREMPLDEREQLNALHSQMLQIITRVADMQVNLENPELRASETVKNRMALNSKGEIDLPLLTNDELTTEIKPIIVDSPTKNCHVIIIDNNEEFLKFAGAQMKDIYQLHLYNSTRKAAEDLRDTSADVVICKEDMKGLTGSELCNMIKSSRRLEKTKFILMTDHPLTQSEMNQNNITLAADDYLAKPFNMQEAIVRINQLLGYGDLKVSTNQIEGSETRMLEGRNASMTTATESYESKAYTMPEDFNDTAATDDEINLVETAVNPHQVPVAQNNIYEDEQENSDLLGYSMSDKMDEILIKHVEQYVTQNMSRGQINLEDLSKAMGMGRVPFFHKIRNITGKTPAEVIRDIRLKHACILLKRTDINMSELAIHIGFMTAENFINIFKERFNMTPLEYRLKHRKA